MGTNKEDNTKKAVEQSTSYSPPTIYNKHDFMIEYNDQEVIFFAVKISKSEPPSVVVKTRSLLLCSIHGC